MTHRFPVRRNGFTLIELVVAISISAILVSFMATFITTPVQAYFAQSRRATLLDSSDTAVRMMANDLRGALPNSVRLINSGSLIGIELLATADVVEYRDASPSPDPRGMDFNQPDSHFSTLSAFGTLPIPAGYYLSIGNAGTPGPDAYELAHVITPNGATIAASPSATHPGEDDVSVGSAVTFNFPSPTHKMFLVPGPTAYLCDTGAQTLTRFSGYTIAATTSAHNTAAKLYADGATGALVAQNVVGCQFDIVPPASAASGQLVILRLLLSSGGDNLQIVQEMPVENIP